MVISTPVPERIGDRFTMTHDAYPGRTARAMVIREATKEEWIASCIEVSGRAPTIEPGKYFYLLSID